MATNSKGNQVRVVIVALLTAKLFVMNLQVLLRTADLAPPSIAAENLFSE
jgi:hypothetical protein